MTGFRKWFREMQQQALTKLVNRTFRKDPGFLDRLAGSLLRKMIGETSHDPELDHPDG
ncbi:hypothetical protein R0137_04870 [Congregibacter brevis]|uniref:Uncharacterized protein n=1 Tax=Congregibacter brevis TaxID=3081201 RepID=A0ABZ0IFQ6_9GAMM|nr:hypothetical protein R0137_04870 [Congregibacter sp. IMCC45268]